MASTAVSAVNQGRAAKAQGNALTIQAQSDQNALALQQQQLAFQAANTQNERVKEARSEAATFDAISGEFGSGVTANRGSAAITFNRDQDLASINNNRDASLSQIGQEAKAADSRYQSGMASIVKPSVLGTALTIAGQAGSGAAAYRKAQLADDYIPGYGQGAPGTGKQAREAAAAKKKK